MVNEQIKFNNPPALFDPNPFGFSHSVVVDSPLKICYISGQSGGTGKDHQLSNNFRTQVTDALNNLKIVLNQNSMSLNDVVKITLLITNHNQEKLEIWTEEAKKVWQNSNLPTSTLIPVNQLALPNMMFEVDAIAIQKM
ncbi:RidA family protein [Sphingobacterium sp. SG20118]|uniref:RidA family protein n=1 Tax=Sphingobacterium sp. SG20118 TaxID=3367156 RepID=UPI0037DFC715